MKILVATLVFNGYTGSEWYNYELCRGLAQMRDEKGKKLNKVYLLSQINPCSSLNTNLRKLGVQIYDLKRMDELPLDFDIIHFSHYIVGKILLEKFKNIPMVTTIHSEIINLEAPLDDERIKKYISIRPSIKNMIDYQYGISLDKIVNIWNPIDETRFNSENIKDDNYILFHGSLDYLRKESAYDCIERAKKEGLNVVFVGRNDYPNEFNTLRFSHCIFKPAMQDLSVLVKNCTYTAGILLGRSTIEGYLCGKKGLIYYVDDVGNILNKEMTEIPEDLEKFKLKNVINQIYGLYNEYVK